MSNTTAAQLPELTWTLVYLPKRGRIARPVKNVPAGLSWSGASALAVAVGISTEHAVWYVPSREFQAAKQDADTDNLLMADGRRVPIRWDAPSELDAAPFLVTATEETRWAEIWNAADETPEGSRERRALDSALDNLWASCREGSVEQYSVAWYELACSSYWSMLDDLAAEEYTDADDTDAADVIDDGAPQDLDGAYPTGPTGPVVVELSRDDARTLSTLLLRARLSYESDAETWDKLAADFPNAAANGNYSRTHAAEAARLGEILSGATWQTPTGTAPEIVAEEPVGAPAETARAKYAGTTRHNYWTLPTEDVEILPDVHTCSTCGGGLRWTTAPRTVEATGRTHTVGEWVHDGAAYFVDNVYPYLHEVDPKHRPAPRTRCGFCHTEDPAEVQFVQASYSDETRCTRCGGTQGFGIGD